MSSFAKSFRLSIQQPIQASSKHHRRGKGRGLCRRSGATAAAPAEEGKGRALSKRPSVLMPSSRPTSLSSLFVAPLLLLLLHSYTCSALHTTAEELGPSSIAPPTTTTFSHPAGWHTAADIVRVRSLIASGKEPWRSAAQLLLNDTSLTAAYVPSPATLVCRTCCDTPCCAPGMSCPGAGSGGLERDGIASYYLMLRWIATSDTAWADAAERVLNAWSGKLTAFAGHDQMLAVGLYGGYLAQAAELLAYAKPSWPLKARAQRMFREVIHPGCSRFCGRTNTGFPQPSQQTCAKCANGNWDAVCMSGVASWAVFLDNATMLESVHQYFKIGVGNGRLVNYIQNSQGQCQESGRDQGHTQLGIFNLVQVSFVY